MGSISLLQGIPTQGLNSDLLPCRQIRYQLALQALDLDTGIQVGAEPELLF